MNPSGQNAPGLAERCFVVVALLLLTGALSPLFGFKGLGLGSTKIEGNIGVQMMYALIYFTTFLLILPRLGLFLQFCGRNKALLALVGLACLSILWSPDPGLTLRRLFALLGTTLFGVYLAMRFAPAELPRLLAWSLGLAAVLSLVFVVALPQIGIYQDVEHHGLWRGVFGHKNAFGRWMVLGMVVFLVLLSDRRGNRWLCWALLGLCVFLAVMSGSRTAWVAGGALLIISFQLQMLRKVHVSLFVPVFLLGVLAMIVGAVLLAIHLEAAADLIGKTRALAGRWSLWSLLVTETNQPWFGHGYRAFWLAQPNLERLFINRFFPGNAHNGLVQLWLQLGYVGLAAFAATVFVGLRRLVVRLIHAPDTLGGLWLPVYLSYFLVYTVPASVILAQNNTIWALYVATLCHLTAPIPAREPIRTRPGFEPARVEY